VAQYFELSLLLPVAQCFELSLLLPGLLALGPLQRQWTERVVQ